MERTSLTELQLSSAHLGDDTFVVSAAGELDLATVERFEHELARVVDLGGRRLAVDLTGVVFIDSTALGALIQRAKRLRFGGGELVLISDDPSFLRTLQITGLDRMLRVERSLTGALGLLQVAV
jgi:anti-sigma B factor antagonist